MEDDDDSSVGVLLVSSLAGVLALSLLESEPQAAVRLIAATTVAEVASFLMERISLVPFNLCLLLESWGVRGLGPGGWVESRKLSCPADLNQVTKRSR